LISKKSSTPKKRSEQGKSPKKGNAYEGRGGLGERGNMLKKKKKKNVAAPKKWSVKAKLWAGF